jgi:hypothetical protein
VATSGPGGAYKVKVAGVDVISDISFDHSGWQPRLVHDVSARTGDDQVIHKVLLDRQGPRQFLPILEQVHVYEGLYYLERELAGPGADKAAVSRAARGKYLERILAMPDPLRYGPDPRPAPPADPKRDPQRGIVKNLEPDQRALLDRKIGELFELYGIPRLGDLHLTQWEAAHSGADGVPTRDVVRIEDGSGSYDMYGKGALVGRGKLSNVKVSSVFTDTIEGRWEFRGGKGFFQWRFGRDQYNRFTGIFGYNIQDGFVGEWNGQRTPWRTPPPPAKFVIVYDDYNFSGYRQNLVPGRYDWGQIHNDTISSVSVPEGMRVTLYTDTHFRGRSKTFTQDTPYVGDDFNDKTSSVIVE